MKSAGVLVFPGTQCDQDTAKAFLSVGAPVEFIWHTESFDFKQYSSLVVPGGFSYGDYLRAGALAARSPAVKSLIEAVKKGWPVLGICNGFQILCEAGILPGALVKNESLRFVDAWVELELKNPCPFWVKDKVKNPKLPIAHSEGRYFADKHTLEELQQNGQIWFTYKKNPNGSLLNIAGLFNKQKNAAALMPHPERAFEDWMGSRDGVFFF